MEVERSTGDASAAPLPDKSGQSGSTLSPGLMSLEAFTTLANSTGTTCPSRLVAAYGSLQRAHEASLSQLALLRFVGTGGQFLTDAILTRLARLADENDRLADVVREASQRIRAAEEAADAADVRAGEAEGALLDAQAAAAALQAQLDESRQQMNTAQSSLQASESRVASLVDESRQLKQENEKLLRHSHSGRDSAASTHDGLPRSSEADKYRATGYDPQRSSHADSGSSRHRSEAKERREVPSRSRDRAGRHDSADERLSTRQTHSDQNADDDLEGSVQRREGAPERRHRDRSRQREPRHRRSQSGLAADKRDENGGDGQRDDNELRRHREKERARPRNGSTSSRTRSRSPKRSRRTHSSASDASTAQHVQAEGRSAALGRVEEHAPPATSKSDAAAATAKTSESTSTGRRDRHSILGRLGLPISAGSGQQKVNGDNATNGQGSRSFGIRGRGKAVSQGEAGRAVE